MKNDKSGGIKIRSYRFSLKILEFTKECLKGREHWIISNQLVRSATSVGANVSEARGASSRRDFINYFQIALKSANETKYWLCLLRDTVACSNVIENSIKFLSEIEEISKMIAASIITLKRNK
ncbi:MAG: four helix bundle protein [Candidatus Dojkabacteria bacterium]|jgi:four helix bundle protein|nr:four helix bundle protein [Candidatus Dojkabacteria bacterium]